MRAKGLAGPQLGHHEVVHHATVGVARPGHGQNVMAEPVHQQGDVIGQGDRLIARRAGPSQVLGRTGRRLAAAAPVVPPKAVALFLVVLLGLQGAKGAIVKESDQGLQVADDVEDIASTGDLGQGQGLAGTEATAGVGDGGLGIEALVDQLQEAHTPGIGVAMILQAEQIAIRRRRIDTHEHRVAGLKDFVVSPDPDAGQIAPLTDRPGWCDRAVHDVVHVAQGDIEVEEVTEQLDHTPVRTVVDQHQR